jgi:hypothetical protein
MPLVISSVCALDGRINKGAIFTPKIPMTALSRTCRKHTPFSYAQKCKLHRQQSGILYRWRSSGNRVEGVIESDDAVIASTLKGRKTVQTRHAQYGAGRPIRVRKPTFTGFLYCDELNARIRMQALRFVEHPTWRRVAGLEFAAQSTLGHSTVGWRRTSYRARSGWCCALLT